MANAQSVPALNNPEFVERQKASEAERQLEVNAFEQRLVGFYQAATHPGQFLQIRRSGEGLSYTWCEGGPTPEKPDRMAVMCGEAMEGEMGSFNGAPAVKAYFPGWKLKAKIYLWHGTDEFAYLRSTYDDTLVPLVRRAVEKYELF